MLEVAGYCLSILVGIVLGLLGGGGSILSIPILVYLFNIEPVLASAYSLFIVGVTSFAGAIPKYKQQLVHFRTGLLFGLPSIIAIFATRMLVVPAIPEIVTVVGEFVVTKRILILGVFSVLMIFASISMIRGRRDLASGNRRFRTGLVMIEGLIVGFLTGLVGAGGGFLIIPALVFLTGLKFKTAVGTSLFVISINSLIGFTGDLFHFEIDWPFLLSVTAIAVVGIMIGHQLSKRVPGIILRKIFGWLTLATGCFILTREILWP
jgi:uncharacterized membrane protein YfcA